MNTHFNNIVLKATSAQALIPLEVIQTLWSGYGEIVRVGLTGAVVESAVLKYIRFPTVADHPRGWNTDRSHVRKVKSYDVEMHWYRDWSDRCGDLCRVPKCFGVSADGQERVIVLEDLDAAGYPVRKSNLDKAGVKVCLKWLAYFHATFLDEAPTGLWPTGTYWHLETRPDEWAAMAEGDLKQAAQAIDQALANCRYQTLVHGDAKVANFCFSADGTQVAAVDFQYVGAGCGMKDVAYLLGSCLTESECEQWQAELLAYYFDALQQGLMAEDKAVDWPVLKAQWSALFPVAWTDFYRFLLGWMPAHRKINSYTQRLASEVVTAMRP